MASLIMVIGMCLAGIGFCVRFLMAIQHERQHYRVCYVLRLIDNDLEADAPEPRKRARALARAA